MRGVPLVKGDKAETAAVRGSRDEKPQTARSGGLRYIIFIFVGTATTQINAFERSIPKLAKHSSRISERVNSSASYFLFAAK